MCVTDIEAGGACYGHADGTCELVCIQDVSVPIDSTDNSQCFNIGKKHKMIYIQKDPDAVLDYCFNFTAWLNGDILDYAVIEVPAGYKTPLWTYSEHKVVVWLGYDSVGDYFPITCHVRTRGGRVDDFIFNLSIEQAA